MTTRMTVQRLARLVVDGETDAVRSAVAESPQLLGGVVERDGHGGWTPLHLAVACDRADVVRVLATAGADLTARTDQHRTPLHVALEHAPELVPVLVELGAVLDAPSAAYLDDVDRLAAELDGGAALTDPATGVDLLAWAAFGGAAGTARLLLDRGADADGGALHAASAGGSAELVRLLLDAGADVDRRDADTGRTPLHTAVAAGATGDAPEIVRALLDAGADVNATTHDGASALDISRVAAARHRKADEDQASGNDALVELLVAHGATH
ncbi:ankyrin repeat domain-containing protein [Blastococcus sp. KM273128]|uniref:ankyrin repeat domain-containing protein n=1 Tax=Blastococcus sp. KM273128 TaxID=2570314 RepID=UPI001F176AAD|nr:ankyrin repeat domain-containing protein [Blastococcus sp. KM273128]MCF6743278.1 ankyrin repeat domain-containing protein [Blastococcus sp. KM273128]